MKLKSIYLSRQNYGTDEGKLTGTIEYDNFQATVALVLSEEQAARIVNLVAEDSLRYAQELAGILINDATASLTKQGLTLVGSVHNPKQLTEG